MANLLPVFAYLALGVGYTLECFHLKGAEVSLAIALAYIVIAVKHLKSAHSQWKK